MIPSRRRVVHDNIATDSHPVWRARYATPLTTRHVRAHYVELAMEMGVDERELWLIERMTPLDKLLTDEEAAGLEAYFDAEQMLAGNARSSDYVGDRVMSSRVGGMSPLPDAWVPVIAAHHAVRARLRPAEIEILAMFVIQQAGNPISDAQCAIRLGLAGRKRGKAYVQAVARCARRIAGEGRTAAKASAALR